MYDYVALTIKTVRKAHNLTQEELASEVGVSAGHIGMLEQGRARPSYSLMKTMVLKYNVDANMFFGRTRKEVDSEYDKTILAVENLLEGVNEQIKSYRKESG
ncbi:MAG: helix-turn-helix transcriptional regulator [Oscillospiraceae bacterium]|nr:helix-turn-helix transcriptional regulator [Oscillospiraceae bacterium]MCL2249637.1 helix-turn-helix transcriptional regulator [Oscillospiraceae bacterium]